MIVQDQSQTVHFLARELAELHGSVEQTETHISRIFLCGDRAYKLKRAVQLPYADFSTPGKRLDTCLREVELNRRTAPDLYRGVRRITRENSGELAFDGDGEFIDAVVEMVRFDARNLFDEMANDGRLSPALMRETADVIAKFHEDIPSNREIGGARLIADILDINEKGFASSGFFDAGEVEKLTSSFSSAHEDLAEQLDRRGEQGRIIHGHGDLHLRNICLFEGRPTPFDCIEFNEEIATVDRLYDLAFLVMDLWHRGFFDLANLVANRYADRAGDGDGYNLMPYFMAVRAAVRAHTTATQITESDKPDERLAKTANAYFSLARSLLQPQSAFLVGIGGLSGSGKSTVAEALAARIGAPPGARILESDRTRKALFGVTPEQRLPDSAYGRETSENVYERIAGDAEKMVARGATVIADAVYSDEPRRDRIGQAAANAGVPFLGIWLEAPADTLRDRIRSRRKGASDADLDVLESQLREYEPPKNWRELDANRPVGEIAETISGLLANGEE